MRKEMTDLRSERGRATRDRLVAAGRELFGGHGYDSTSIDAILGRVGVKRGALYHHFESKQALFDAVLDSIVSEVAQAAADAARKESDPVESLRAGCSAWLRMALDPAVQRIALIDAPAVVGWTRWRELDEQHILGGLRRNLELIAQDDRLPAGDVDLFAHMVLASVNEAALFIARAKNPRRALTQGQATVDTLIDRLVGDGGRPTRR
jgi:AcrR family transcriptional regulator